MKTPIFCEINLMVYERPAVYRKRPLRDRRSAGEVPALTIAQIFPGR